MITPLEATQDTLRRIEHTLEATKAVAVPSVSPSMDDYTRGVYEGLNLALSVTKREQEMTARMYAERPEHGLGEFMLMRLHTPVRKA